MPPLDSPCVRNCCLDDDDVCLGCFRTVQEIMEWYEVDEARQRRIMELAHERRKSREKRFQV